jgi:predicted phage tail protein
VVRGRPITIGGELSLISDGPQPLRSALFTPDNIKKDTLSIRYAFRQQEPFDGYEVEFFEAKNFTQDSRIWPKSSVRPRTLPLLGCTSAAQAEGYARFLWQQDTYLRKLVTFETELEGLIYALGDRIGVSHPLPNWGQSARVERVSGRVLTLDQVLPVVTNPYVFLRNQRGGISAPLACTLSKTPEGDSTIVTLTASAPFTLFGRGDQEPTLLALGSGTDFLQDFTITEIQPTQQGAVRIGGILYDERVWQGVGI